MRRPGLLLAAALAVAALAAPPLRAAEPVRVATYNIRFLDADELPQEGDRKAKLERVIELLEADVIGLQEIKDRRALEAIFPPEAWHLVIDDDSADDQDLAVAVRRPLRVLSPADLDADDDDFLFPGAANETFFPNRRDLLAVEVGLPGAEASFHVLVTHAKSRRGGRAATDFRREGAARELIRALERAFDERDFILLGDFNDTPDDRSLNILETGDPAAPGLAEDEPGAFLINLTEPLYAKEHVSLGRTSANVHGDRIDTVEPGARAFNNRFRGTDRHTGDQLFDQLLVPPRTFEAAYVPGSAAVFDVGVAALGNDTTRASDHLPVYADFVFGAEEDGGEAPPSALRITALLPNPDGDDTGREEVTIGNVGDQPQGLAGWRLRDRAANEFALAGMVPAGGELTVPLAEHTMPLNNGGDEVLLLRPDGRVVHRVAYTGDEVAAGRTISFDE